ncbi:MAG: mercuric reductase [Anaerolineaceae bacterium]|nr:mercuric reductase [Anaerolineaceae bacterium]
MSIKHYDAVIIGSGQAGTPLASALANAGWRTALVERKYVGGTCVNWGCTPTKAMIASAQVAHMVRRSAEYGIHAEFDSTDMGQVHERTQRIVEKSRSGNMSRLEKADGLDLYMGEAHFTGVRELEIVLNEGGTVQLAADRVFINTGERPRTLDVPGFADIPVLYSHDMLALEELPSHLVIVGSGPVGLEFAQMFARFGSHVTVIEREGRLLSREDADIADAMYDMLCDEGVDIRLSSEVKQAERDDGGMIRIQLHDADQDTITSVTGSHVLVAIGRVPNTDMLDVEKTGLKLDDRGYIQTNDRLETDVEQIYALGDVRGGPAFTHISYDDFRIIRANLLEDGQASIRDRMVPYVIFTDPELGRVGITEHAAKEQGLDVQIAKLPMSSVARAIERGKTQGLMKAVIDKKTQHILGCAVLGIDGGELMSAIQIAMMGQLPYTALQNGIFAHPTLMESLNTLFSKFEDA